MRAPVPSVLVLVPLLLASGPAGAAGLELGWDSRMAWDSNPLRSVDDEDPDVSLYVGPNLVIRERSPALDYRLAYRPRYEQFIDLSSVNGFEHFVDGRAEWRITPRSRVLLTQNFNRTRGLASDFLAPVPGIDLAEAEGEFRIRRDVVLRNLTTATFTHQISPLWSLDSSVVATLIDYEDELRQQVGSLRGSGQLIRGITPRLSAGFGAAVTRQQFDDTPTRLESGATIFEGFGLVRYLFSRTVTLSISAGPAWNQPDDANDESIAPRNGVRQDQNGVGRLIDPSRCVLPVGGVVPAGTISLQSCQTRPISLNGAEIPSALIETAAVDPTRLRVDSVDVLGGVEDPDSAFTYFGRVAVTKSWQTISSELSYQRSASASSGLGSTNLDVASWVIRWQPDRRAWSFDALATWSLQTSATDQPGTDLLLSPVGTTVWVAGGRIFDSDPGGGATRVEGAARVIGVRSVGSVDSEIEIETLRFDLRAQRHISENLLLLAQGGWRRQESTGRFSEPRTIDNLRFVIGFTWTFDPIEF